MGGLIKQSKTEIIKQTEKQNRNKSEKTQSYVTGIQLNASNRVWKKSHYVFIPVGGSNAPNAGCQVC